MAKNVSHILTAANNFRFNECYSMWNNHKITTPCENAKLIANNGGWFWHDQIHICWI